MEIEKGEWRGFAMVEMRRINVKVFSFLIVGIVSSFFLTACGLGGSNSDSDFESYVKDHPAVESKLESEIESNFGSDDLDVQTAVDGNKIEISVDISKMIAGKMKKTENNEEVLRKQFDEKFTALDNSMAESISKLEKDTKIEGISMMVSLMWDGDIVYTHAFSGK